MKLIFKLLRLTGIPYLLRETVQKRKISILLYHDISQKTADMSFRFLSKKYNIIGLNDLINAYENNNFSNIPEKALIITFDDGHIGNFEMLPILKKYSVPITIFLCSSIINTRRKFWYNYDIPSVSLTELKSYSNTKRLQIMAEHGFDQEANFSKAEALTKRQIFEMKDLVNFQSHTRFHPLLPKCSDKEANIEILQSKVNLENEYKLNIDTIAYPNGHYSNRDINLAKIAGYKCGISVDFGYNGPANDIFKLKRYSVTDTQDLNELIVKSSGLWSIIKIIIGKKRKFGFTNNNTN